MVLSPMKDPKTGNIMAREFFLRKESEDNVWKLFGITESNKQLHDLVNIIDPLKNVQVKLQEASTPDPNPNAFWCTTTTEAHTTTAKLEFAFTVAEGVNALSDSPVGKVIAWVTTNLGLDIDLDSVKTEFETLGNKIPDILISPTKTTTWSFDDSGQLITPPVEKWELSIQIKISAFNLAFEFTETGTSFYLLPTKPSFQIVNDLASAVGGDTPGLDRGSM